MRASLISDARPGVFCQVGRLGAAHGSSQRGVAGDDLSRAAGPASSKDQSSPPLVPSPAPASALLSISTNRNLRCAVTSNSALCRPRCPAPGCTSGTCWGSGGAFNRCPHPRRGGGPPAVVGRQRSSPHRSLGRRPAGASTERPRRTGNTRPSGRGRTRAVPGGGAERALGLVSTREPAGKVVWCEIEASSPARRGAERGRGGTTVRSDK